mmetsp:Transcript_37042/g.75560  ORF Transcript_37042/g.75560 Transcript_37042/m.75560 type:complete len:116 (+) Transcript_37042:137-484(+)
MLIWQHTTSSHGQFHFSPFLNLLQKGRYHHNFLQQSFSFSSQKGDCFCLFCLFLEFDRYQAKQFALAAEPFVLCHNISDSFFTFYPARSFSRDTHDTISKKLIINLSVANNKARC